MHLQATILCDDIRQEDNGKLILIGVYVPHITVPSFPFTLPTLSVFQLWEADTLVTRAFTVVLRRQNDQQLAQITGRLDVQSTGTGVFVLRLGPLRVAEAGEYELLTYFDGEGTPTGRHAFSILPRD